MPEIKQFENAQAFHSVLLHEMTHATGAAKRLNREGITSGKAKFGNKVYAFEELVAEMGEHFCVPTLDLIRYLKMRHILKVG